jgi:hypothetical protein
MMSTTLRFAVAAWCSLLVGLSVGCKPTEGCSGDDDCRFGRVCDDKLSICTYAPDGGQPTEPDTDSPPAPDTASAGLPFEDDFEDGQQGVWETERSSREPTYRDGMVVFEGTNGSGRHDSKAEWSTRLPISEIENIRIEGRFKMGLDNEERDQRTAIQFRLLSNGAERAMISFYTRWEGRRGTLSDKCDAHNDRGWCTYYGEDPWVDTDEPGFYDDLQARDEWSQFDRSLGTILHNQLDDVSTDAITALEVRLVSTGAWGTNSRGLFDYVRVSRQP